MNIYQTYEYLSSNNLPGRKKVRVYWFLNKSYQNAPTKSVFVTYENATRCTNI